MAGFGLAPVMSSWIGHIGLELHAAFIITARLCLISSLIFAVIARPFRQRIVAPAAAGQSDELSFGLATRVMRTRAAVPIWMVGLGASVFAGVTNFQAVYAAGSGFDYADYFLTYTITVIACRMLFAEFVGGRNPYGVIALLMVVMAVNEAEADLIPQTMQLFGLSYFIGVFRFPFAARWIIVKVSIAALLRVSLGLALVETALATRRFLARRVRQQAMNLYQQVASAGFSILSVDANRDQR